jgi:putative membrane protein
MKVRRILSSAAALSVLAMFGLAGSPSAVLAQTEEADQVLSYETVFGSLEADGTLRNVRLVSDLRIIGEGDIVVTDPTSTEDFRTLSGFSEPELSDGQATYTVEGLDGEAQFVTASTPDEPPPVSMTVTYYLNGERIAADDLVGQSGRVQIVFDVSNDSGEPQQLTYKDGDGNEHTFVEEVPIPMVAQLTLELPPDHFTNIEAPDAEQVVDPRGNITALWNLVLIPPIGSTVQSPEIVMDAEDFEMGAVRLVSVPVAPETREFLAFAEEEFASGEDRASGLYSGATELSDSIDELHEGTLDLVDGMERLLEGSRELTAGLGEAFSGSGELAAGLGRATAGSGELTAGLGEASAGSGELTAGIGRARSGSGRITGGLGQLRGGLQRIGGGLDQLAAGLPEGQAGAQEIAEAAAGIQQIAASLAGAMTSIANGANAIVAGANQIQAGAGQIQTGAGGISAKAGGVTQMANGISATCAGIGATCTGTQIDELAASIVDCATGTGASCGGGGSIQAIAGGIAAGAGSISTGAGQIAAGAGQIAVGAGSVQACLVGSGNPCSGNPSVSAIAGLIRGGAMQLAAGIGDAISGVGRLSSGVGDAISGTTRLFQGSSELTAGLGEAFAGSSELTAGLAEGAAGSARLTSGLVEATTGAGLLNAGLGEAAAGSGRLSEGIGEAQDGAKQIEQGVYSVNELGVKEIARGANDTAADLARSLALMEAQDERAATEAFTYGPPSSDQAETVVGGSGYVLTMDQLDGRQEDSTARAIAVGVGFLALIGMGILGARSLSRSPS